MKITFYFDPSCPFSWIASRWLLAVQDSRKVEVDWRPFCLAIKNDELSESSGEAEHAQNHRDAHRMLRVMLAAERDHKVPLVDSYNAAGMIRHVLGERLDDGAIQRVLAELRLSDTLLAAADDASWDARLSSLVDEAAAVAGGDVGVPVIVYRLPDGSLQGYFGPVLNALPDLDESLAIWDGLARLATAKVFYELKRTRPEGDPDTASTARC